MDEPGVSDLGEMEDVFHSKAFQVVNDLLNEGQIGEAKADRLKQQYTTLFKAHQAALAREKTSIADERILQRQHEDEERRMRSALNGGSDDAAVETLREDAEQAEAESSLASEREQMAQLDMVEMQRQRNEMQKKVDEIQEEHRAALQPQINKLEAQIAELKDEIDAEKEKCDTTSKELFELNARCAAATSYNHELSAQKKITEGELAQVATLPEKARRRTDLAQNGLNQLKRQEEGAAAKLHDKETTEQSLKEQYDTVYDDHLRMLSALDRGRVAIEAKKRAIDDIHKDYELTMIEHDKSLSDSVELDMRLKALQVDLRRANEELATKIKEKESALRWYAKAQDALEDVRNALPPLVMTKNQAANDVASARGAVQEKQDAIEDVRREVDMCMHGYLKEDVASKEKNHLFQLSYQEVNALESEVKVAKTEEGERERTITHLGGQRDQVSRLLSQKINKLKEASEKAKLKELVRNDLKRVRKDIIHRVRDFEQLYNLVKNQRNKFVNLIQAANQSIGEMREKLKVLANELDILRADSAGKDKLLANAKNRHATVIMERDSLRTELNKLALTFRAKQDNVDEQIAEIDKLNAIINAAEKEMLRLKKQYEVVVEARNYTGVMLIDRNDELCVLYEKHNIQEDVLKRGTLELNMRDDEKRVLSLEIAEVARSIEVTKKILPQIPVLDENVALLQKEVLLTRGQAEKLSLQLENPHNQTRWRWLGGKVPEPEELGARIAQLEQRLNDKKEQLLEKELILQEVSTLSDNLRQQASDGRADTLELAKKVNDHQNRLRAVTRRMMATVSELSMYQASALKLGADREELELDVGEARRRLEAGEAPTEEAEREWYRMERERITLADLRDREAAQQSILDQKGAAVESMAEQRPNAYIPDDLGIPKPYGSYAPFKPSEPGSTMRHIRKPEEREIVI